MEDRESHLSKLCAHLSNIWLHSTSFIIKPNFRLFGVIGEGRVFQVSSAIALLARYRLKYSANSAGVIAAVISACPFGSPFSSSLLIASSNKGPISYWQKSQMISSWRGRRSFPSARTTMTFPTFSLQYSRCPAPFVASLVTIDVKCGSSLLSQAEESSPLVVNSESGVTFSARSGISMSREM